MHRKTITAILLIFLLITGCSGATSNPTAGIQPTVTRFPPSATYAPVTVSTTTPLSTFTLTPVSNSIYYMIVVDSSVGMSAPFDGKTKLEAARESVSTILAGLEPGANYGLLTIGGSPTADGTDACNRPSVVNTSFSPRQTISKKVSQLEPVDGGSMYSAFFLARQQFEGLPPDAIRSLIFITDSVDECSSRDEWRELENLVKIMDETGLEFHSEIILLDQNLDPGIQVITDRIEVWSKNVIVQIPQNFSMLREANEVVIGNITKYVNDIIAVRPAETPIALSFTPTPESGLPTNTLSASSYTLTPKPGALTSTLSASSYTLTPKFGTPTVTPSATLTPGIPTIVLSWTPSISPVPPSSTAVSATSVSLLSVTYLTLGTGCQIDVQVRVTGGPATGVFRVRNASYAFGESTGYPQTTLQVGTNWASEFSYSNQITLSGNQPAYYQHEVWFEYNGRQSNHLTQLVCPGIPPP